MFMSQLTWILKVSLASSWNGNFSVVLLLETSCKLYSRNSPMPFQFNTFERWRIVTLQFVQSAGTPFEDRNPAEEREKRDFPRRKTAFFKCQSLEPELTCVLVLCDFLLRVCGSQSSAPPHNLEVDYDFNDFLFQFRAGAALPWFGREKCWKFSFRWRSERKFPSSILSTCQ